jgi:hypothetical protein
MVVLNYPTIFLFIRALEEDEGAAQQKESRQKLRSKIIPSRPQMARILLKGERIGQRIIRSHP